MYKCNSFVLGFFFLFSCLDQQAQQILEKTDNNGFTYQYFKSDPTNTRVYTLDNGLKVYLSSDSSSAKVQSFISVRAGSADDPSHATGLAHYLEHLLFNGTDSIGAINYEKERTYLEQLDDLFEKHGSSSNMDEKKSIYAKIDSLSYLASAYGMQSEYTAMLASLGASGINAMTQFDFTTYTCYFPVNQIENWIDIEYERFRNPVFRGFHVELEAVFEEQNGIVDNGYNYSIFEMYKVLFDQHPYGSKTPIGKMEDLKNPSLIETRKFYNQYYVPNNMGIVIVGDFDPDKVIAKINGTFGKFQRKPLKIRKKTSLPSLTQQKEHHISSPGPNHILISYAVPSMQSNDIYKAIVFDAMLSNTKTGMLDINVMNKGLVKGLSTDLLQFNEHSMQMINITPNDEENLNHQADIVLNTIEDIKNGNFENWHVENAIANIESIYWNAMLSVSGRASLVLDAFKRDITWHQKFNELESIKTINKEDLILYANSYFKYPTIIYKTEGQDNRRGKINKPKITPVKNNDGIKSAFRKSIEDRSINPLEPKILDFERDLGQAILTNGTEITTAKNNVNDYFVINLMIEYGLKDNNLLQLFKEYYIKAGTTKLPGQKLGEAFARLNVKYDMTVNEDEITLYLFGDSKNFEKAIKLLEQSLTDIEIDEQLIEDLKSKFITDSKNQFKNRNRLKEYALKYVEFGEDVANTRLLSEKELDNFSASNINELSASLIKKPHYAIYFGPLEASEVANHFKTSLEPTKIIPFKQNKLKQLVYDKDATYVFNHESTQVDLIFYKNIEPFSTQAMAYNLIMANYLGKLFFSELRESRGLAYSAWASIPVPQFADYNYIFNGTATVQSDKIIDALATVNKILEHTEMNEQLFNEAKESLLSSFTASRYTNFLAVWRYRKIKKLNLEKDYYTSLLKDIPDTTFEGFKQFYNEKIKNTPTQTIIVGEVNQEDLKVIKQRKNFKQFISN